MLFMEMFPIISKFSSCIFSSWNVYECTALLGKTIFCTVYHGFSTESNYISLCFLEVHKLLLLLRNTPSCLHEFEDRSSHPVCLNFLLSYETISSHYRSFCLTKETDLYCRLQLVVISRHTEHSRLKCRNIRYTRLAINSLTSSLPPKLPIG